MDPNPASMNGPDPESTFKITLVQKICVFDTVFKTQLMHFLNFDLTCPILETVNKNSDSELIFKMFLNFDDLGRKSIRLFSEHYTGYFVKKVKRISLFKHKSRYYCSESVRNLTDLVLGTENLCIRTDTSHCENIVSTLQLRIKRADQMYFP